MINILCLIGATSTGKSEIEKKLKNYGLEKIISYTTRKPRQGEIDGIDYHFITNEKFEELEKKDFFVEKTSYTVNGEHWWYGFSKDSFLENNKSKICVINPSGLLQLMEHREIREKIVIFHIVSHLEDRITRYMGRESNSNTNFDKNLAVRCLQRLCQDDVDFREENIGEIKRFKNYFVIENNGNNKDDLDRVVVDIFNYLDILNDYRGY